MAIATTPAPARARKRRQLKVVVISSAPFLLTQANRAVAVELTEARRQRASGLVSADD